MRFQAGDLRRIVKQHNPFHQRALVGRGLLILGQALERHQHTRDLNEGLLVGIRGHHASSWDGQEDRRNQNARLIAAISQQELIKH
jgi:hypothetical protein